MVGYAIISVIATTIWLISSPFVSDRVSDTVCEIASKSALVSLLCLVGTIAFAFMKPELPEQENIRIQSKKKPLTSVDDAIRSDCRFLNPDADKRYLIFCTVEPEREHCLGCPSYLN